MKWIVFDLDDFTKFRNTINKELDLDTVFMEILPNNEVHLYDKGNVINLDGKIVEL